jgi:hypothetical protein
MLCRICLQDDDLRELRDTREWIDMMSTTKGGLTREQKVNLRAEAKVRLAQIFHSWQLAISHQGDQQGHSRVENGGFWNGGVF